MIYFTSDTHFNHDREFIYGPRGFSSAEEMNKTIINNWNSIVTNDDDIYVVGDFFLGTDITYVESTLKRLNGKIHLIIGNHDTPAKLDIYERFSNIVEIVWATQIKYNGRLFYVSHYPTLTADLNSDPKRAVFNLFGHTHSKDKFFEDRPYMYNVAVDAHNNKPISIEEIFEDIQNEIKKCITFLV